MITLNTIFDGTVTLNEYLQVRKHRSDTTDYLSLYNSEISKRLGVKYAYSFGSGRGALYALLKCLRIGEGDEVIIQGYTCVAVPKAIMYAGAKPIYADISLDDYSMTLDSMKKVFTDCTRAVIIQHTYGIPCRSTEEIYSFCHDRDIVVIEDCAHTFGGKYKGRFLGTIGDAGFFSTDHSKYISTSVGGIAITDNELLGEKLKDFYDHTSSLTDTETDAVMYQLRDGLIWSNKFINRIVKLNKYTNMLFGRIRRIMERKHSAYSLDDYDNYTWPDYSFPAKLSDLQALLGLSQLERFQDIYNHRKDITAIYNMYLKEEFSNTVDCDAPLMYPIMVDDPEHYVRKLKGCVEVSRWFKNEILCIDREEYPNVFFDPAGCPNASYAASRIINLPNHSKVSMAEARKISLRILKVRVS